jgi:uncharacterized protein YbaR (Trm112 family)
MKTVWDLADREQRRFLASYIATLPEKSLTTRHFGLACPRCEAPLAIVPHSEKWRGYLACRECWLAFSFCSGRLERGRFRPPGFLIPWEEAVVSESIEEEQCSPSAIAAKHGEEAIKGACPHCRMLFQVFKAHRATIGQATIFDEVEKAGQAIFAIRGAAARVCGEKAS